MLAYILFALLVVLLVLLVVVALQPADFKITRSKAISAPPAVVFSQVNDFHKWEAWSPWAKMDPNATMTIKGEPAGVGAIQTWSGNNKVGAGCSTIIESLPAELVRLRLEFLRPFKATNIAEFTFRAEGSQTVTTWSMTGKNNFMSKAFGLIINCDKMVGAEFEKGLAQMKVVSEAAAAK